MHGREAEQNGEGEKNETKTANSQQKRTETQILVRMIAALAYK